MSGTGSSRPVMAEMMITRRKLNKLQKRAANLAGYDRIERWRDMADEIGCLLFEHSLAEWLSLFEREMQR